MGEKLKENVTPPRISKETMKEMAAFFARTSIPRIIENMEAEDEGE
ncbi:hypothetical protein [Bacillus sp. BHET2]|nr:hypothetical protein [Bacillus sp. BHET2]